ncbi:MAG: hypothetical protein EO766_12280 [Hydrotalea sp. AMD]|uniref:hypothetical protein n=1 Tax=Hydrotalea sp. AMD TaxID=2501297 RepID=UPI0010261301|nr:hypothetical protein [Hydrotalea sp. AMD]RWZ87295.1 MAG: hypothetical protein EO766_12280 [Hydrotalea sp. AMD]
MKQSKIGAVRTVLLPLNIGILAHYYDRRVNDIKLKVVLTKDVSKWSQEEQNKLCNDIKQLVPNCLDVKIKTSTQSYRMSGWNYLDISTPSTIKKRKKRRYP